MITKLTLTLDDSVIAIAKQYAKKSGKSLSDIVENYLKTLTSKESAEEAISPRILNLMGVIELPENFDYKSELSRSLSKKYKPWNTFFFDTNVLIDYLANRQPFAIEAAKNFNYSLKKKTVIYISAVSYNNIYYILRQSLGHSKTLKILNELQDWTEMIDVSKEIIQQSLKSDFKDFEDAIQYPCAKKITKVDCIVTRDTKDYKLSSLPVMTPKEALSLIESYKK